jgi:GNAT superfamily N-acetyltransferase
MFNSKIISDQELKGAICESILRSLPNWFGAEESILDYVKTTKEMPFYVVYDGNTPIGFVAIKIHNRYTAEVYVMGVLQDYHRRGIGKFLINQCEEFCLEKGLEFLSVKTLDESRPSKSYEKTRVFYTSVGFRPLEVFKTLWGEENPCLYMVKYLQKK